MIRNTGRKHRAASFARRLSALALLGALAVPCAQAAGAHEIDGSGSPGFDAAGTVDRKVVHRLNPQVFLVQPWAHQGGPAVRTQPPAGSTGSVSPAIAYHAPNPVMPTVKVYVAWYGNWNCNVQSNPSTMKSCSPASDTAAGQQIIRDALYGLSTSNPYSAITNGALGPYSSTYNGSVSAVSSSSIVEFSDGYRYGQNLRDSSIAQIVSDMMTWYGNADPNGVYLVLTSSDVRETSGFCTQYCGWHTYGRTGNGTAIKYGFVGNAQQCPSACTAQPSASPNGNVGVDGMVSVIAHELEEAVSDPRLNAWYNANGAENGDMCAWTFGSHQYQVNGAWANVTLATAAGGLRSFLVQRALAPSNSGCYIDATNRYQ